MLQPKLNVYLRQFRLNAYLFPRHHLFRLRLYTLIVSHSIATWNSYYVILADSDSGNYTITHPIYAPRENDASSEGLSFESLARRLDISAPRLGRHFHLHLIPSPRLLADDFRYFETFSNGSLPIRHEEEDTTCYFRAENAALDLCGGVVSTKLVI